MPRIVKIPKKIAGVKLPKKARKTANKALKMGASPLVREIAIAAVGAGGGRATGDRKEPRADTRDFSGSAHIHVEAGQVADAFRAAAIDGLRRFLEGFEEGLRNISEAAAAAERDSRPASGPRPGAARD